MAVYYKYKGRDLDKSVIDWSGITKTISTNLMQAQQERDKLRSDLETKHQEQLQKLNEYEQGLDPTANRFALEQAQAARKFLLENHKVMKQGLRSVDESKLIKQGVTDTWTNISESLKTYNDNYKRISQLDGKANEAILAEMSKAFDLKDKKIYYDPNSGNGYFVKTDPTTGDILENSMTPVRSLNDIQSQSFKTIDLEAETAKIAARAGTWKIALSSTRDLANVRNNPTYKSWLNNSVKSILVDEEKKTSILLDHLDLEYTDDPKAPKGQITYQRVSGYDGQGKPVMEDVTVDVGPVHMKYENGRMVPKFTKEQEKLAEDAVVTSIENKLAFESSQQYVAPQRPTAAQSAAKDTALLIDKYVRDGSSSSFDAVLRGLGAQSSRVDEATNKLYVLKGGAETEIDLNQPATEIGIKLAGLAGIAESYANDTSLKSDTPTSTRITEPGFGYGSLTQKVIGGEMSTTQENNWTKAITELKSGGTMAVVQSVLESVLQDSNLPLNLIEIRGDNLIVNDKAVGGPELIKSLSGNRLIGNLTTQRVTAAKINDIISKASKKPSAY